jgi:hypothetical protein
MKQTRPARPAGLTVLAVLNLFHFLATCIFLFALVREVFLEPPGWLTTLLATVSGLLALVSAIGFLRRSRLLGLVLGNAFGIFLLVYSVGFLIGRGTVNPMEYFAWLSYPVVLLLALNFLYVREFDEVLPPPPAEPDPTPEI